MRHTLTQNYQEMSGNTLTQDNKLLFLKNIYKTINIGRQLLELITYMEIETSFVLAHLWMNIKMKLLNR